MRSLPRKGTIIVADDDPGLRHVMYDVLVEAGFWVSLAASGEEVLEIVGRGVRPCLIVCDRMMPGLSFEDLVEALAKHDATRSVPVAVMTGSRPPTRPTVAHVLIKPFTLTALLELAHRACPPSTGRESPN
jgi:CheY-like chemotaxis protein